MSHLPVVCRGHSQLHGGGLCLTGFTAKTFLPSSETSRSGLGAPPSTDTAGGVSPVGLVGVEEFVLWMSCTC